MSCSQYGFVRSRSHHSHLSPSSKRQTGSGHSTPCHTPPLQQGSWQCPGCHSHQPGKCGLKSDRAGTELHREPCVKSRYQHSPLLQRQSILTNRILQEPVTHLPPSELLLLSWMKEQKGNSLNSQVAWRWEELQVLLEDRIRKCWYLKKSSSFFQGRYKGQVFLSSRNNQLFKNKCPNRKNKFSGCCFTALAYQGLLML